MVPQGDITILSVIIASIIASLIADGIFLYNVLYSIGLPITKCLKGNKCVSDNLLSSMPAPIILNNSCTQECITNGYFGGHVIGCCVKGEGEQKIDPFSVIIVSFGFIIMLAGSVFLYFKYCEWRERRQEYTPV